MDCNVIKLARKKRKDWPEKKLKILTLKMKRAEEYFMTNANNE